MQERGCKSNLVGQRSELSLLVLPLALFVFSVHGSIGGWICWEKSVWFDALSAREREAYVLFLYVVDLDM